MNHFTLLRSHFSALYPRLKVSIFVEIMTARKFISESELDPERKPPVIPFALSVAFACLPLLAMIIIIPSSTSYADAIDLHNGRSGNDTEFAGFTVSALPLALTISLFPLAWLFSWCQSYRFMIWLGIFVSMAGHLMYGFSGLVMNKWYLLAARLVQGAGSYQALNKVYVTEMAAPKHRTYLFTWYISCVVCCFVLGNFLAYFVDIITSDWNGNVFNRFTCPAWLMLILYIAYAILVLLFWQEPTLEQRGLGFRGSRTRKTSLGYALDEEDHDVLETGQNQTLLDASISDQAEESRDKDAIASQARSERISLMIAIGYIMASSIAIGSIAASWEMLKKKITKIGEMRENSLYYNPEKLILRREFDRI